MKNRWIKKINKLLVVTLTGTILSTSLVQVNASFNPVIRNCSSLNTKLLGVCKAITSMTFARGNFSATVVDDKIYAFGGTSEDPNGSGKKSEVFNPTSNVWKVMQDTPEARWDYLAFSYKNKIFTVGSKEVLQAGSSAPGVTWSVDMYDPKTNKWVFKCNMLTPRSEFAAAQIGSKIYIIGGSHNQDLPTVEEYDILTNNWTKKADLPTARTGLSAIALNGKIYAIGGFQFSTMMPYDIVEEYDPRTDSWTTKTSLPTPRARMGIAEVNGKIYTIGGIDASAETSTIIEEYNPKLNSWRSTTGMLTGRASFATAVHKGKIYILGGQTIKGSTNACEEYTPPVPCKKSIFRN